MGCGPKNGVVGPAPDGATAAADFAAASDGGAGDFGAGNLDGGEPSDLRAPARGLSWPDGQSFPSLSPFSALDVIDLTTSRPDEVTLFTTLEGLINREQPRIYVVDGVPREGKTFWLDQLGVTKNGVADPYSLISKYKSEISGIIIYDDTQIDTIDLATTIAGVKGGIVASPTVASLLTAAPYGLAVLDDLRTNGFTSKLAVYQYQLDHYSNQTTHRFIAGLTPTIAGSLRDLAVATRAMVVWLDPTIPAELNLLNQFLAHLDANSPYAGWWTNEPAGVADASKYAVPVFAADSSNNLSVLGGTPRAITVPLAPPKPTLESKIYVAIFMSDGDNVQEDQHLIPQKWADPNRGKVPIAWTIDPVLVDAAPIILNYFWSTASANDVLVSGPSGVGYTYPANWPITQFDQYTRRSGDYMNVAGLRCITVWDNGADLTGAYAASYALNMPRLLGVTMQSSTTPFQLLNGSLPMVRFASAYADTDVALEQGIDGAAAGWPGNIPLFIAVQGNMNKDTINPTAFYNVQQHYAANSNYVFVRADHFFQLIREANNLPIEPMRIARGPLGDFDGDKRADFADHALGDGRFWVHAGTGAGLGFDAAPLEQGSTAAGPTWNAVVGDFNGDGRADYADHAVTDGHLFVHLNMQTGFSASNFEEGFTAHGPNFELLVADFDGDGKADYADHALGDGHLWVHLNVGTGFASTVAEQGFTQHGAGWELLVGDFDGDGKADYADHALGDGHLFVHLNTGAGFSAATAEEDFTQHGPEWETLIGDFDGDGKADYADHSLVDGRLIVHRNTGTGFTIGVTATGSTAHGSGFEVLGIAH